MIKKYAIINLETRAVSNIILLEESAEFIIQNGFEKIEINYNDSIDATYEYSNNEFILSDFLRKENARKIPISDKIESLWQAANKYQSDRIQGAALSLTVLGMLQQFPKCLAVSMWIKKIWTIYYERKAIISEDIMPDLDFTIVGPMPYSVPELMEEVGI